MITLLSKTVQKILNFPTSSLFLAVVFYAKFIRKPEAIKFRFKVQSGQSDESTEATQTTFKILTKWMSKDSFLYSYTPSLIFSFFGSTLKGSMHTIIHTLLRRTFTPKIQYNRELLELSDKGTVGIDWVEEPLPEGVESKIESIVILHHGLCGSSESQYALNICRRLHRTGRYKVCVMVGRGCGKVPLTTPEGFTAHRTLDMRECIAHVANENKDLPVMVVGVSLGAGLLGKYLGEEGKQCILKGAVMVSPSWCFLTRTNWFDYWSEKFLVNSLKLYSARNEDMLRKNPNIDFDGCMTSKDCNEFDYNAIIRVHDFGTVDDYYEAASAARTSADIYVPTLSISAEDDPVCCAKGRPGVDSCGPGLIVASTPSGGHCCWGEGIIGGKSWMDGLVQDWFDSCCFVSVTNKKED